jgi:hypothetical protein
MVCDYVTVAKEEVEMDYIDEEPANQDKTMSEAVEWQDMLSDGGEVSGDDEVEVLGSQA